MTDLKLYDAEFKFMNIIWEFEPINSTKLINICKERLGWKKPTTYTVIRKLSERDIVKNENATVTALVKKEEIQKYEADTLLEKAFDSSLPSFIAAFLKGRSLTEEETRSLKKLIEEDK